MSEEIKKVVIENTTKLVEIINANGKLDGIIYNKNRLKEIYEEIYQFICNIGSDKEC